MARDNTVADVLARQLGDLARLIRNMLIDNPNLKNKDWNTEPYYFREYPQTSQFVREVLAGQANTILDRVDTIQCLVADMTGDIDLTLPDQRLTTKADPGVYTELLEVAKEAAEEPCSTLGLEDLEGGCCKSCRARAAIANATGTRA